MKRFVLTLTLAGALTAAGATAALGARTPDQRHVFAAARHAWIDSQCLPAAGQGPSWRDIASSLVRVRPTPRSFRRAAGTLRNLAGIPETGATAAQGRQFARDAHRIDRFFGTRRAFFTSRPECTAPTP